MDFIGFDWRYNRVKSKKPNEKYVVERAKEN